MTLTPTWQEFRMMSKEFFIAAKSANEEELEAGFKCLGLAYLGIQFDEGPFKKMQVEIEAPTIIRLAGKAKLDRELELGI